MKTLTALMVAVISMIGIPTRPGSHPNPHTPPPISHVHHR